MTVKQRHKYDHIRDTLMEHPGQWALIAATQQNRNIADAIRQYDNIEVSTRTTAGGLINIYARYVEPTTLGPDHPAVEAAIQACAEHGLDNEGNSPHSWKCEHPDRYPGYCNCATELSTHVLVSALPHLTSNTEDNLARLRDTPVGRELMAEGWDGGLHRGYDDGIEQAETTPPNPYRKEIPNA